MSNINSLSLIIVEDKLKCNSDLNARQTDRWTENIYKLELLCNSAKNLYMYHYEYGNE